MTFITQLDYDFVEVDVEFEVDGSPYLPATISEPEEGGIERFYDIVIIYAPDEFEHEGEFGPSLVGMKLDHMSDKYWDELAKAVESYCPY